MKWVIELSEFDIRYKPRAAVKGQILADFIMEVISMEPTKASHSCLTSLLGGYPLKGASNARGSSACLILTSPDEIDMEYVLRLDFQASNNEAEYEAVIAGLNLAHVMEADQLEVYNDSQLVVKQIKDSYEAIDEKMILYLKRVRELLKMFVQV